ncbi:MAG: efflux RND transporter periplasmic adaptor subunit [Woeseiaceae bacterium]
MNIPTPILTALAIASMATLAACGVGEAGVADRDILQATTPIPVEVAQPYRRDIHARYETTATLTSDADAPVIARVAGELVELLVEEGDTVTAGQVLGRLDGERLRLEMLAAKANLARVSREFKRNTDLHERGLISASMFDGLKYERAALEASYKLAALNYDYSNIRATIAGVVSAREIKPGQNINVGDVAFRITDAAELVAYLQIPQSQLPKFQAGHTASVQIASMPGSEFPASIVRISPTIDSRNGTFRATAVIQNEGGDFAPGMFGRFTIAYETHPDALVVQAAALLDEDEQTVVYVVNNGQVTKRVVETGIREGDMIEILGGLSDNDNIVVVGHTGLREGSKVFASHTVRNSVSG